MRKLGEVQTSVLRCLKDHKGFRAAGYGCGWYWNTRKGTAKICDALVKRGVVDKVDDWYYINETGLQYLNKENPA
ncbi:hypothetical protein JC221_106 [Yersinia phage JC221]|nr:hypothetical protein JC221_106 [Yersinia phage JC221]